LWWERARDLSAVIDGMLADPTFMVRIDAERIGGELAEAFFARNL
jgi:predicted dienelactone hydrolase